MASATSRRRCSRIRTKLTSRTGVGPSKGTPSCSWSHVAQRKDMEPWLAAGRGRQWYHRCLADPNPYAAPSYGAPPDGTKEKRARGRYTARFAGEALALSRDAELPAVCLKCGARDEIVRRTVKLQWTPVWARFLVFCLIGAILVLVTTKRATLEVPLCVRCDGRWGAGKNVSIGGVVALVGAFLLMRFGDDSRVGVGLLFAVLAAFVAVSHLYVKPRMLRAQRIDDAEIILKGVAAGAAQVIVDGSG